MSPDTKYFEILIFLLFCHTFPDFTLSRHDEKRIYKQKFVKRCICYASQPPHCASFIYLPRPTAHYDVTLFWSHEINLFLTSNRGCITVSRYTIDAFDAIKGVLQFQDIPLTHLMHCDVTFNVLLNHVIHPQLKSEVRKFRPVLLNIFGISDTRQRTSDCGRFFF